MSHDPVTRYRRLADHFDQIVSSLTDEELDRQSPCEGWKVRDVVGHVADTERDFLGRMGFADVPPAEGDERARWTASRQAVEATLADPARRDHGYDGMFGPTKVVDTIDAFYSMDLVVHAWDVAAGAGRPEVAAPEQIDDVRIAREHMAHLGDAMRMPGVCGPEVPAPAGASEYEQFLAWTGRDPNWQP